MKGKVYAAGLYLRLSKDDGEGESASIGNQRKILLSYAKEHGFSVYDEYVDDGYSGTNFDRPGWRHMLADIEEKRVNLVLTKDLSRLGRDYITAGQYTEFYFPARGVRFIAVNDGYDSESPNTDIAPFKNIINEMYARDTSKKIRSALRAKMDEGAYIGNFAPYGYQKDPENKNRLRPDPVSAPTVRALFRLAEEGAAPGEIAAQLNTRCVPTPSLYRRIQNPKSGGGPPAGLWTSAMVCKLLANPVYLGHVAQGKTTKVSFKSPVTLRNPKEEWIVAKCMHQPLVTLETFETVQRRRVSRRNPPRSGFLNIFSGLAFCADCGRAMSVTASRRKGTSYSLVCGGYKLHGGRACTNHFMDYNALRDVVLEELKSLTAIDALAEQRLLVTLTSRLGEEKLPDERESLHRRERELDRIVARLYEDSAAGRLDETRFYKLLAVYEAEQRGLTHQLDVPCPCARDRPTDLAALLRDTAELRALSPALLRNWIDRIEVSQGRIDGAGRRRQAVRIFYKCTPPGI